MEEWKSELPAWDSSATQSERIRGAKLHPSIGQGFEILDESALNLTCGHLTTCVALWSLGLKTLDVPCLLRRMC